MAFGISRHLTYPFLRWRIETIEGLEHIPRSGPALLVANHVGHQDPLLLIFAIARKLHGRAPYTIAKWKIFHSPFAQRWLQTIPLYRDRKRTVAQAERELRANHMVLIYPEAGINRNVIIQKVKTGAARLALATGAPVIPIGIQHVSSPLMAKIGYGTEMLLARVRIRIGLPIDLSSFRNQTVDRTHLNRVMAAIMQPVAALANKTYTL